MIADRRRVLILIGTRPEAIKMAPLVARLRDRADLFETRVCLSGQHKELLQPALDLFGIAPDYDFDIVNAGSGLNFIARRVIEGLDSVLDDFDADYVGVQGDTTTTMAASLAAFYRRVQVLHVEAGLRSGRIDAPWPEEANRRISTIVSTLHFAPTTEARDILLREGVAESRIVVTGNTVVDALHDVVATIRRDRTIRECLDQQFSCLDPDKSLLLVTGHRRENFGEGFSNICESLRAIASRGDVQIVYPVHLNPNVREPVQRILGDHPAVRLIEPVGYREFAYLMMRSALILTDSGGVQEEAPSLGKQVLVMREVTERREALALGRTELVGTSVERIVARANHFLDARAPGLATLGEDRFFPNPFGDGRASDRIVARLVADIGS